ncbi:hypothetical protein J6590_104294 [Homalodisca vitripennis]|nr:hypothetical protein J6590_104294 [Homalodisca vitripennis]
MKPSLTIKQGSNALKVFYEPPPMAGQTGYLQGQDRSAVTHPSRRHYRRCWCYNAPLVPVVNFFY